MTHLKLFPLALIIISIFFLSNACYNEANAVKGNETTTKSNAIEWYSIEDLEALQKKAPKKVIVDVYTDWCKWCKVMDKKTFEDPEFINFAKDDYYFVKLDGETQRDINYSGKTYSYVNTGRRGYHQLASVLLGGRLSYPSCVILDENLSKVNVARGYKSTQDFKTFLSKLSI